MKIYDGMTSYCPSYQEGEPRTRQPGKELAKRRARKKAAKKARKG